MIKRTVDKFIMDGVELDFVDNGSRELINQKVDKSYVDSGLEKKADISYVNTELGKKADTSYVDTKIGGLLKVGENTATTSQFGLMGSGKSYASCYILGAWVETGGYLLEPYVSGSNWGIRVMSRTTLEPVPSTEVTAKFLYIDRG